ncbi:MAG: outer membrane protein assembly factor BamA [Desulfobacula sp.]|nr:outer membrane protein assembly factor BamA [Desulfobacula sp.]
MYKKAILLVVVMLVAFANFVFANATAKIAIFPFKVYSEKPRAVLANKIPSMIQDKIELEGAKVVFIKQTMHEDSWGFPDFRAQGIKLGVDYILTGSIFVAGQSISIDTKLVSVYEQNNVSSFFADADKFENLFSTVSKISKEIISDVFHKIIITDVEIAGNKRIEADAILRILETQPGDIIKQENISKDLRKVYKMGYFDNVVIEQKTHDNGVKIVFEVEEKPSVRKVKFNKNLVYEDEELSDSVDTRTGSILNIHKINGDLERMRLMYTEKNYHNCQISYEIIPLKNSQADIVFTFEEGNKIKVEQIAFEGNKFFSEKKLKKTMQTSEKGFLSFITSSGDLKEAEVKNDVIRIESLYKNNGFVDAKVSDPIVDIGKEFITIRFKIEEGDQFSIRSIDIDGDLIITKQEIIKMVKSKESQLYNRENIRKDIISITNFYSDKGFANVEIKPLIQKNREENTVNITYSIDKKQPVYFNRINISGNFKTRDKVIRREIRIEEQGLYSKANIQRSFKNLNRLDYFADIDVKPVKTDKEDEFDLDVTVVEKETGQFSFGGGFSTDSGGFFMISIAEKNLFGKGQNGKLSAQLSQNDILYSISFYEPYILDTRVSGGFDLYKQEVEYDFYDKDAIGFSGILGYKLFDYTQIGLRLTIEDYEISNIQSDYTYMTLGKFLLSSIKPYIKYDSRNDFFTPTEGMKHMFSIEYAGEYLGSDIDYTKFLAETGVYIPLFWKFTGTLHAEGGYIDDRSADSIDIDYAKFYLGGIDSIRGFDKTDINGQRAGDARERGGEIYTQFNIELTFPVTEKYKMIGVLFYDRGDVYRTDETIDFGDQFSSFGAGIRWNSPMGPLRIEYGWVIDGKDVKKSGDGQFEFSVGASF